MLKIEHLCKKFNGRAIVNNVSLTVKRGEIAVLLGSSGVGKSTMLRLLNNLETADSGVVFLDGKQLDLKTVHKTHAVGMIFQQFHLFEHLTVERNVTLALEKVLGKTAEQAHSMARNLLEKYGLLEKAQSAVSDLSGGQKQRLAIVRALALKPQVICFDEPTSALDPLLTSYIAQQIQELADQGHIIIVATHDMGLLEKLRCTIYLMKDGSIVETAFSEDLWRHKERYPRLSAFISGDL